MNQVFMGMPSVFCSTDSQGLFISSGTISRSRFFKNRISVVASVPATCLKAVFGRRMAPRSSARCARYLLLLEFALSMVYLDVMTATIPPGRVLSRDFARK